MKSYTRLITLALVLTIDVITHSGQLSAAISSTTNTWLQLPNTKLSSVCPSPANRLDLFGTNISPRDCHTITTQWSGGTWDEQNNRLIILGGGHGTYYGNEPYALDLTTQALIQMDSPPPSSVTASAVTNCSVMSNGEPGGRHTYSNLAWVDHLGVLVMVGGAGSCTAGSTEEDLWVWDGNARTWTRKQPNLRALVGFNSSAGGTDAGAVYDAARQKVWFHDCWNIYEYRVESNSVTTHMMSNGCQGIDQLFYVTWIYDSLRQRYVGVGEDKVIHVNLSGTGSYQWVMQSTSGSQLCQSGKAPGLAYDVVQDAYICWNGGNTVYRLSPTSWAWTTSQVSGTAPPLAFESDGRNYGTYGKFQYSKKENAFVYCGDYQTDCYALRLTAGGGGGIGSDTSAPSVPGGMSATAASSSQINLAWNASTDNVGVTAYKIYRNGSIHKTVTGTSYSDTGLAASTTYAYTVSALDAALNESSMSTSASATTLPLSPGGADFQSRCSAPGVLVCRGWDSAAELTPPSWPNSGIYKASDGKYHGTFDSTIKASGGGSLRFEILGGTQANSAGHWWEAFGQNFVAGQSFYVMFKQRFSPEMISIASGFGGGGWKQVIFHNRVASCANIEITTTNLYYRNYPIMYSNCGSGTFDVDLGNGDFLLQQGDTSNTGYNCHWKSPSPSTCAYYQPNQWITYYYEVRIGNWGQPNTSVKAWIAYEGQPLKQWINITNHTLYQDAPGLGFDYLTLTPYDTGKDGRNHATAYTWYDELIISTQPIPGPNDAPNPPPAAPTNLRVQ